MFTKKHRIFSLLSLVLFMSLVFPACNSDDTTGEDNYNQKDAEELNEPVEQMAEGIGVEPIPSSKLPVVIEGIDPNGITVDESGNLYIVDGSGNRVLKISVDGVLTTFAGNGEAGFSGDGGPATAAQLYSPADVALDSSGNLYIADELNRRIRKVTPEGIISTVAGGGDIRNGEKYTLLGDGGGEGDIFDQELAISVSLFQPNSVVVDNVGNIYFSETAGGFGPPAGLIQKVSPDGLISTFAGCGTEDIRDGIPATSVRGSYFIFLVAVDLDGYVYVTGNNSVFEITPDGMIYIVAGSGTGGYSGDGGPAIEAELGGPRGIVVDEDGALYIAEFWNNCIREVTPEGAIYTVVDELYHPTDVAVAPNGSLFIAEHDARRVLKLE